MHQKQMKKYAKQRRSTHLEKDEFEIERRPFHLTEYGGTAQSNIMQTAMQPTALLDRKSLNSDDPQADDCKQVPDFARDLSPPTNREQHFESAENKSPPAKVVFEHYDWDHQNRPKLTKRQEY